MMLTSLTRLAAAAILVVDSSSGSTRAWIADIKADRAALAGQDVRLEGEVVDLRSTSPTARRGFYRLTDASDPGGVLVRTETLPMDGGNFRLVARVAANQLVEGALLMDEVERHRTDGRPIMPMVAVTGSALAFVLLMAMLLKALREEREYFVTAPLWLLPHAGPYHKALPGPGTGQVALTYQPEAEEADQMRRLKLQRRKRSLMQALLGSLALTGSSAAWVINTRPQTGVVPAFIFIDANDPAARAARGQQTQGGQEMIIAPDSALLLALDAPPMPALSRSIQLDTMAGRRKAAAAAADSVQAAPVRDTPMVVDAPRVEPVAPLPVVSPTAPPPPPETREPARDPEVERAGAGQSVSAAAARLVAAINARRMEELAALLPEVMAGDLGRREQFLNLVREFRPRAVPGAVAAAELADDRAQARFGVTLTWRGDFGVDRRNSARFQGVVRREGGRWRFEGASLLDSGPLVNPPRSEPVTTPALTPAPAPPPPPQMRQPVPESEPERSRAGDAVSSAAARLVAAIDAKRMEELAVLLPEVMAGDRARRERFLKLVREFSPKASLGAVADAAVNDDRGEAGFSIAFVWRGDFGVDRSKSARFQGVVRREGGGWRFEGARLLDPIP